MILAIGWLSITMLLWFKTNVVGEYLLLLNLTEYSKEKEHGLSLLEWLNSFYGDKFLIKLISCEYCFNFWLSGFASLLIGLSLFPLLYLSSLLLYRLVAKLE